MIFALSASLLRYQVSLRANCMRTPGVCILASRDSLYAYWELGLGTLDAFFVVNLIVYFYTILFTNFILFLDGSVQI